MQQPGAGDSVAGATISTTLGQLRVGDRIAALFGLATVTEAWTSAYHRATIVYVGERMAGSELGPSDTPWLRCPRPGEVTDATPGADV